MQIVAVWDAARILTRWPVESPEVGIGRAHKVVTATLFAVEVLTAKQLFDCAVISHGS